MGTPIHSFFDFDIYSPVVYDVLKVILIDYFVWYDFEFEFNVLVINKRSPQIKKLTSVVQNSACLLEISESRSVFIVVKSAVAILLSPG